MTQGRTATIVFFLLMFILLPAGGRAQEERDTVDVPGNAPVLPAIPETQGRPDTQVIPETSETPVPSATPDFPDSLSLQEQVDSLTLRAQELLRKRNNFKPDPKRALWLSLVFPGAGQIYNRKYWKLPIVYGGFLGCYYALSWNNQMLRDYSQAYLDIMDDDPNTKSYEKMLPLNYSIAGREARFQEIFKNKKNYYRKYRDMSILAFAVVYAIAVIDAYVDAELSTFDISPDLSLEWAPAIVTTNPARCGAQPVAHPSSDRGFGVALRLNF